MKLRANISFEVEAADYIEAADHQKCAHALFEDVKRNYPGAELEFRHLRPYTPGRRPPRAAPSRSTGMLAVYEDKP